MAKSTPETAAPHEFPFWPFGCTAFYSHALRDLGRYSRAMTQATDAMQATRAEGDFGLSLWQDLMQAYFDLAVLPMTLAAAAAQRAASESAPAKQQAAE